MATEAEYLTSFYFKFMFVPPTPGSSNDAGFKEITGLTMTSNVEEVVSGGENRFKYRLPQAVTYPNLELKRGVANKSSPLLEWVQTTLQSGFTFPIQPRNVLIALMNEAGDPAMTWYVVGAYPVKWSASELSSDKSEVLIESIELAYQYFEVNHALQ